MLCRHSTISSESLRTPQNVRLSEPDRHPDSAVGKGRFQVLLRRKWKPTDLLNLFVKGTDSTYSRAFVKTSRGSGQGFSGHCVVQCQSLDTAKLCESHIGRDP